MKRSKKLGILLAVLVVACAAAFAALRYEEHRENIQNSGEIILEVPADTVVALSWEYGDSQFSFHRDGTWIYDEDEAFPVNGETVEAFLARFEAFGAAFRIEDVENYGQYGLDTPVCTVRFSTQEQSYEILLGDYSTMDAQRYVSIGDGNVYLVADDPLDDFDADLSELIQNDEIPSYDQVAALRFSGAEDYEITYEEDVPSLCADDVYFTQRGGKTLPLDTSRVDGYLDEIGSLDLTDYVTYNVTQEELKAFGLNDPELTVTMDYTFQDEGGQEASGTFVLHISRSLEERAAAQEEEEEENAEVTAYARVGDSQIVYQITSDSYQGLMAAGYDDLRHLEVFTGDFGDVTQVDVTLEGETFTLTSEGEGDGRVWRYGEETVEMDDFQDALEALSTDRFTQEASTQREEISLALSLDHEDFPQMQIDLYRYDGSLCLAVVDGESVSLVERAQVVDLIEAVNAIVLN